ncbi:Transcriptional repressor CTCF [Pseudolycoriella hygida]|uniref:Transcriptional repressor CTCF n=1 Tax=Pseudolycoriella hygida TaxID=35572 RepID=A0A9Q0S7X0_9DIPT|nr:Transcriptional repressor CTCF [Pseudolycoriella hygida]
MCDMILNLELVNQSFMDTESKTGTKENREHFICDMCGLTLYSKSGIRRHLKHKHLGLKTSSSAQSKTEICNICGIYTTKRNFKDHVNSHSKEKNFKCSFCETAVKSIFTLRKHIKRVHLKIRMFECQICKRQFTTLDGLKNHDLRRHKNSYDENGFQCRHCDVRFSRSEALKNHLIKHKDEWSFGCGICPKSFKHSSSVSGHRKSHKVNGFYQCGCCDARFKDYRQLKDHFESSSHSFYSQ